MTDEMIAKREALKVLSGDAKTLIKMGQVGSVNDGLAFIYRMEGHEVLKSYKQWRSDGYQVKKGSKALLMWGEPLKKQKEKEGQETDPEDRDFFPLAYVFSNMQVEPLQ